MENNQISPIEPKEKKKNLFLRGLLFIIKSPINVLFGLALAYFAFQAYILSNSSWMNKPAMIAVICLWIAYIVAKYALKLVLILIIAGAVFYGYLSFINRDAKKCEENGGVWNKTTRTCEEKNGLMQKIQKLWNKYTKE